MAVEFALLLPVMAMFYLGGVQIAMAVSTYRLVDLTANTVTNLVAQYTTISQTAQMPDILAAATQVMYPVKSNDPAYTKNVKVVVSLISIDKNGNATVAWSQTLNGTARVKGSKVTVPPSMIIGNGHEHRTRRDEIRLQPAGRFPEARHPQPVVVPLHGAARLDDHQPDVVIPA